MVNKINKMTQLVIPQCTTGSYPAGQDASSNCQSDQQDLSERAQVIQPVQSTENIFVLGVNASEFFTV